MKTIQANTSIYLETAGKYCEEDILIKIPKVEVESNEYNVKFISAINEEVAAYSVKQGETIKYAPDYPCKNWKLEDGTKVTLPITPSQDITVYANVVLTALHDFFEQARSDIKNYPYCIVHITDYNDTNIYFTKSIVVDGNKIGTYNSYFYTSIMVDDIPTTVDDLVFEFVNDDGYIDDEPHLTGYSTIVGKITNFINGDSEYYSCKGVYANFPHNLVGTEVTLRFDE